MRRKLRALVLSAVLLLTMTVPAGAESAATAYDRAAAYVLTAAPAPTVGSIGGEWAVIGLLAGDASLPEEYISAYAARVEAYVRQKNGVLHSRKYTEYSRVILAMTALGRDARDVGGYDLTLPLGDYEKTVFQGLNGPVWALIALDSGGYPVPEASGAKKQATRQMYVDCILSRQLPDGGWSASGVQQSDPDMTAMALRALSNYRQSSVVEQAVERGVAYLSACQLPGGGYASGGTENAESCAQVLMALDALGIPVEDSRFVKADKSVLDALLSYQLPDGSFSHVSAGGSNLMATEQALCALGGHKQKTDPDAAVQYIAMLAPHTAVIAALCALRLG